MTSVSTIHVSQRFISSVIIFTCKLIKYFVCRCYSDACRAAGASDREAAVGVGQRLRRGVLCVSGLGPSARHHTLCPCLLSTLHRPGYQHWAGNCADLGRQQGSFDSWLKMQVFTTVWSIVQLPIINWSIFSLCSVCVSVHRKWRAVLSVEVRSRPVNWWSFHRRKWRKTTVKTLRSGAQAPRYTAHTDAAELTGG